MVGVLEKILWGLSALALVGIVAALLLVGLPSTTPTIAMESRSLTPEQVQARLSAEQKDRLNAKKIGVEFDGDGNLGPRSDGRRPASESNYEVNRPLMERMSNLNDCISEMQFASSEPQEDGTLKIFDIAEGSLLAKVGLKDNDVLERINGLKVDFRNHMECHDRWQESLRDLERGEPIVVEIRRRGARHHLVVTPGF